MQRLLRTLELRTATISASFQDEQVSDAGLKDPVHVH
jgi:hypothetical protein